MNKLNHLKLNKCVSYLFGQNNEQLAEDVDEVQEEVHRVPFKIKTLSH